MNDLVQEGIVQIGTAVDIPPYTVETSKVTVAKAPNGNKASFSCEVWHAYVPRSQFSIATLINDLAMLDTICTHIGHGHCFHFGWVPM